MNVKRFAVIAALLAGLGAAPMLYPVPAEAAGAAALQPREGWYKELANFDFVRANVDIPLKKGVTIIDSRPAGACTQRFPTFSTTRRVAGGPFEQSLFKCQLIPVAQAIGRGFYGQWSPTAPQVAALQAIFPQGVCDYSQPDASLPPEWL